MIAAVFLLIPQTRIWGVVAAVGVTMVGTVILFANRRMLLTVPCLIVLAALIPVALAL